MKFYTKTKRNPTPVILPLIDILAILLIFFIVTSTFKKPAPKLQINLPDSATAVEQAAAESEPLLLLVRDEQAISLGDEPVALDALAGALRAALAGNPARPLAMQADRDAPFGVIVRVLDALREAGIKNIPAFTQPKPSTEP